MTDYKKLYFYLFNAITDAVRLLEAGKLNASVEMLKKAQEDTEEMYITQGEK